MYRLFRKIISFILRFLYTFYVKFACYKHGRMIRVNGKSVVNKRTTLGDNVNFNGMEIRGGGKTTIGNNFHSGRGCLIITQIHNYDSGKFIPYDDTYILKDVTIEDNVWLGDRVIVLAGAHIEEGAIIQAGSVVVSRVPKCAIAGGHPARVFKYRDVSHYETLKMNGLFF